MSDSVIKILPESVVNQIAAGEVIQTPSSVVKELLENAIDAGATKVEVLLKDSGRTFIKVIDNGRGMSVQDAKLAFVPHATSKLSSADDLFNINTMGFRGEALATIAAVSQLSMTTRRAEDELSFKLELDALKVTNEEPGIAPTGTSFCVRNLFYNIPARRKFLGDNSKLIRDIKNAFIRVALVYPEIEFVLKNNDKNIFVLIPENTKKRILAIYSNRNSGKLYKDLLPVEVDTKIIKIRGFVGTPEIATQRDVLQYFFVNGRYIVHKYLRNAIYKAFETLLPAGKQPTFFLYLNVDPSTVDVNIHPTKTEVKFENEIALWPILNASIREVLAKYDVVPSISFDESEDMDIRVFTGERDVKKPEIDYNDDYNPFNIAGNKEPSFAGLGLKKTNIVPSKVNDKLENPNVMYSNVGIDNVIDDEFSFGSDIEDRSLFEDKYSKNSKFEYFDKRLNKIQLFNSYILLYSFSNSILFDQHRASICILYERFLRQLKNHKGFSQTLLFPEELILDSIQMADLERSLAVLKDFGFIIKQENNSFFVHAVPEDSVGVSPCNLILDLLVDIRESDLSVEKVVDLLASSLASKLAVRYGKVLSVKEMDHLISDFSMGNCSKYTPLGKLVFKKIELSDLKGLF